MGSRLIVDGVENVYQAAGLWVDRALRTDDSLFTPGVQIWSIRWLRELRERFLDRPDEGARTFYDKLRTQLAGSPPEVYQLMGEVLYAHFLIIWRSGMKGGTKKSRIEEVLGWGAPVSTVPNRLVPGLTPGIANLGQARSRALPNYVGFIIEFVEQWKELDTDKRIQLLRDPWTFKGFAYGINFRGQLFRNRPDSHRPQREGLLHLVFPDTFEGIVSTDDKKKVVRAFANLVKGQSDDDDRQLGQIRWSLEADTGRVFRWWDSDIRDKWDRNPTSEPWDEFVRQAQAYVATEKLEMEEIKYKIEIGRKLTEARAAVLNGREDWADLYKRGLVGNLVYSVSQARHREWVDKFPEDASEALKALWAGDEKSAYERIGAFTKLLPTTVTSGTGSRLSVASVLLMGVAAKKYPPFRTRLFEKAYDLTGYDQAPADADEAALYKHALGFLDRFIKEAANRGLRLRHRLDAQSVVWAVVRANEDEAPINGGQTSDEVEDEPEDDDDSPVMEPDLQALAEETFLPVGFLEEIDRLLKDKRQVIFQGPPGTGKTYVAQKLARCLAGSKDRVTLVQFHPSYAYEDFVQGFRPVQTGDGQAGFELRDGPLLRAAERARREPGADHFLVIDEINRGNLAKVFGELYFLLEYRDEEVSLQYQQGDDDGFSLPENLYIIGTMNTADRSIALVDLALRRRFYFVEFHPDDEPVRSVLRKWLTNKAPAMEWVADVVEDVNEKLEEDRHAAIGPSYFMKEGLDRAGVERVWKHSVIPYVEECLFGDNDKIAQFDLEMLRGEVRAGDDPQTDDGAESGSESAEQDGDA